TGSGTRAMKNNTAPAIRTKPAREAIRLTRAAPERMGWRCERPSKRDQRPERLPRVRRAGGLRRRGAGFERGVFALEAFVGEAFAADERGRTRRCPVPLGLGLRFAPLIRN
ncbi:MAG: hypothetical protein PVF41_04955, partial [Methyloceanibacter sp.]